MDISEWRIVIQSSWNCSDRIMILAKSPLNMNWQLSICACGRWIPLSWTKSMSLLIALSKMQLYRAYSIAPDKITMCAQPLHLINCLMLQCPYGWSNPLSRTNILCLVRFLSDSQWYRALPIAPDKITMLAKSLLNMNRQLLYFLVNDDALCPGWIYCVYLQH